MLLQDNCRCTILDTRGREIPLHRMLFIVTNFFDAVKEIRHIFYCIRNILFWIVPKGVEKCVKMGMRVWIWTI